MDENMHKIKEKILSGKVATLYLKIVKLDIYFL